MNAHDSSSSREHFFNFLGTALPIVILSIGAVVVIYPFLWMFSTSMRPAAEVFRLPPSIFPERIRFDAYIDLLFYSGVPFFQFFINSCRVTFSTVFAQLTIASAAAYAFARLRFRGRGFLFALLLSALMIPRQVTAIPLYIIMARMQLINTHWALILPEMIYPFGIFLLRQNFLSQPIETEEAARIDGAGYGTIFFRIALPQSSAIIAALCIISFNATWNEYFLPLIFLDSWEMMTLPVGIAVIGNNLHGAGVQITLAAVMLAITPTFLVFCFAQRYIIEGISMSGIKG